MSNTEMELPWTNPAWRQEAQSWIRLSLAQNQMQVNGRISQPHIRPWSTVLRVPTDSGRVYFKATSPTLAHEPALTKTLSQMRPDIMPEVLAIDDQRGWMLMRDMEATLRSQIHSTVDLRHWEAVLPLLAQVQQETAVHTTKLLALGALDRRLSTLPTSYAQLLDDRTAMMLDQPDGLTTDEYRQLQALSPEVERLCTHLAAFNIPETIHHEDFHDANVFVCNGRYILSDWGESGISHPFSTLLVTLRSIAYRLKLKNDAPDLMHLRDIVNCWRDYETKDNLQTAFNLAYGSGMICRALTWHRVISPIPAAQKEGYATAVPGWLQEFHVHTKKVVS